MKWLTLSLAFCLCVSLATCYQIGVGRADCTGPTVEVIFMGYAHVSQRGQGLHLRQFARSFIIDDGTKRVVFVSVDGAMISHPIRRDVVKKLQLKYGDIYQLDNVMISGTHTHGAPGGFMMHVLYDISVLGFVPETYRALVSGIFNSIVRAHESMKNGRVYIDETEILDANINRSPTSYLNNPKEERDLYKYDTDKTLTQLRFVSDSNELIGAINWFAVHPTSMNNTNKLVTSDNVGYASILLEHGMDPNSMPGQSKFVGAFASANLGDSSPNTDGPKCEFSRKSCDLYTSTCPKNEGACFSSGPGKDHFESCHIIATKIYEGAMRILNNNNAKEVTGPVNYIHQFIDVPTSTAKFYNKTKGQYEDVRGCLPAMGYSFAAGTTDGPGAFDFRQGTKTGNPLWNTVRNFLAKPTPEDIACQAPKPILLATGRARFPYAWQPRVVPTQLFHVGDVVIVGLPGEFTTMSGRRVRAAVREAALQSGANEDMKVILAGLSNIYTSYVATPEEYLMQRYEAASTIFGPHTLTIYLAQFQFLMQSLLRRESIEPGPRPEYLDAKVISTITPVVFDSAPINRDFGSVMLQPNAAYNVGEIAHVRFISGNPRNDLRHERTYLTVEKLSEDGKWAVISTDASWDTRFVWRRTSFLLGHSSVDIFWEIPPKTPSGTYRIRHFGTALHLFQGYRDYIGCSKSFNVNAENQ